MGPGPLIFSVLLRLIVTLRMSLPAGITHMSHSYEHFGYFLEPTTFFFNQRSEFRDILVETALKNLNSLHGAGLSELYPKAHRTK